jgi:hypothetical protein
MVNRRVSLLRNVGLASDFLGVARHRGSWGCSQVSYAPRSRRGVIIGVPTAKLMVSLALVVDHSIIIASDAPKFRHPKLGKSFVSGSFGLIQCGEDLAVDNGSVLYCPPTNNDEAARLRNYPIQRRAAVA